MEGLSSGLELVTLSDSSLRFLPLLCVTLVSPPGSEPVTSRELQTAGRAVISRGFNTDPGVAAETEREGSRVCQFGPGRRAGRGAETLKAAARLLFTFHASELCFTNRGGGGQLIQTEPSSPQVITIPRCSMNTPPLQSGDLPVP